jgi:hypothetical protein
MNARPLRAMSALVVTIETITPEKAATWLAHNPANRNLAEARFGAFAAAMLRGEWRLNGESIKFDLDGDLLDGQHRLAAVVKSGVTIQSVVVRGVPRDDQKTIDIGAARIFADLLTLRGEAHTNQLAAAVRMVYAYEETGIPVGRVIPSARRMTPTLGLAVLARHPGLREWVTRTRRGAPGIPASKLATYGYIFSWADSEDAEAFIDGLITGNAPQDSAITVLRERFIRGVTKPSERMSEMHAAAIIFRAFNHWCAGTTVIRLTAWKGGGARPDRFPGVDGTTFPFRIGE